MCRKKKRPFSGQIFYLLLFFALFDLAFDLAFAIKLSFCIAIKRTEMIQFSQ